MSTRNGWCVLGLLCWCLASTQAHADVLTGKVTEVIDGDTVVIQSGDALHRVRLSGVDAPERDQPGAELSTHLLSQWVLQREVRLEWYKRDRYNRLVGQLFAADPACRATPQHPCLAQTDVAVVLLKAGTVWWFKRYASEQPSGLASVYQATETSARQARAGLWHGDSAIPPWDWRHRH